MAKKKGKRKPKRYDPTAESGFPSKKAFNRTVRQRARTQIRPELEDIRGRRREAKGAHTTRQNELTGWYGFDKAARETGFNRLNTALQGILGNVGDIGGEAQAGLSAAMRATQAQQDQAAANLGATSPTMNPDIAAAASAYGRANNLGLAGDVAGMLGESSGQIGLSGIEGKHAGLGEQRRFDSLLEGLSKERSDVVGRLPDLMKQVRAEMIAEQLGIKQQELAESEFGETRRSNKATERLAGRQQDLAEDQFGEEKKQNRRQHRLNKQEINLRRKELNQAINEAKGTPNEEKAKAAAERFDNAVEWVNGYLAPNDQDKGPGGKFRQDIYEANRSFDVAFQAIRRQFGMGPKEALRVMLASPNSGWQKHAQKKLNQLRKWPGVPTPVPPL